MTKVRKLYILVRTDMDSMTPGRIAAQCAHAANQFVWYIPYTERASLKHHYEIWRKQTGNGYGTTVVLNAGNKEQLQSVKAKLSMSNLYTYGVVIDPEYPIRDGEVTHIIKNVETCAYAFFIGDDLDDDTLLEDLELL